MALSHTETQTPRIAWIAERVNYNVASFRYRSLIPAYELAASGVESIFTTIDQVSVADADVFVFIKVFAEPHVAFAQALHQAGKPYILDLCDNIFWAEYAPKRQLGRYSNFLLMAPQASAIVVTCNALAKVVREHLPDAPAAEVIPDASFSLQDHLNVFAWYEGMQLAGGWRGKRFLSSADAYQLADQPLRRWIGRGLRYLSAPREAQAAAKRSVLKRLFQRAALDVPVEQDTGKPRRRKLIWFGKHGTTYSRAGMQSLATVIPHLIKINNAVPIELVIISNHRGKFRDRLLQLPFPTRYRVWSNETVFDELRTSDVFLMPNETDGFSACKSANRAVMSLEMGVPVVATWLDSLQPLEDAIVIDDWERGLESYLLDHDERARSLSQAAKVIAQLYAPKIIGERWRDLARLAQPPRPVAYELEMVS
jgi:glycosyltransferase involved in cell wall biosynthesis